MKYWLNKMKVCSSVLQEIYCHKSIGKWDIPLT